MKKKLAAILTHKRMRDGEAVEYLRRVDANHAAGCATDDWQKENNQYAKALRNWLAPAEECYDAAPAAPTRQEPVRLMA